MELSSDVTNRFIRSGIKDRIDGLDDRAECTAVRARSTVRAWQEDGDFVVANAGAYDALGLNHLRGLIQARILGAAYSIGSIEDMDVIYDLASSDSVRLILSLDTNEAIRENKAYKAESGDSIRPLYDWETRASMLALQSIHPGHNLVDYITRHGPEACVVCQGETCWHSDKAYSVASTGADLTIVKSLSDATRHKYSEQNFHVVDETDGAFFDRVLDSQISTTALVRRVKKDRSV